MSVSRSVETNRSANVELRTMLESHDLLVSEVVGRSRSGSWAEESLCVASASRKLAARIGGQFGQKAIFELADGELRVVRCSDRGSSAAAVSTRVQPATMELGGKKRWRSWAGWSSHDLEIRAGRFPIGRGSPGEHDCTFGTGSVPTRNRWDV